MSACLDHVRKCWAMSVRGNHDSNVFRDSVEVLSARPGEVKCVMRIQEQHLNGRGVVHGGVIMTLVDDITWLALQTLGTPMIASVSASLAAEFTRPCGQLGEELHMTAEVAKRGRRICFVRITFYHDGEVCAYGTQTVAVVAGAGDHEPASHFSEDGREVITGMPPKKAKL